jgi:16S rRNA (uracil1498-N3)-methyltransferase
MAACLRTLLMPDRFFVDTPITSDHATLIGPEAHHLSHVMRAQKGETVILFDGSGDEYTATVERLGRSEVELVIIDRQNVDREGQLHLTLAVALPKGDRQKWLIEKAVEIGVARIVPLQVARGVAQAADSALERLRRSVIEASKQCGRNRLLEIAQAQSWNDFLDAYATVPCRLLAHPSSSDVALGHSIPSDICEAVTAIGPEGGFTDQEVELALSSGWQPLDLGRRILRIETAALVVAARLIKG